MIYVVDDDMDVLGSLQDVIGQFWTTPSQTPEELQTKIADVFAAAK